MAPRPALKVVGLDPGSEANFALSDLDLLIVAFFVLTTSTVVRGGLCKASQTMKMAVNYITWQG